MPKCAVTIFDKVSIDKLVWPDTADGQYTKSYLLPIIKEGAQHYIDNTDTEMIAIQVDDLVLPATINNTEYENSYVCSPYTLFVNCGLEKVESISNPLVKNISTFFLRLFQKTLQKGKINKIIFVNNWLFTTNLYPKLSQEQIRTIICELKKRYPDHAIAFRSITQFDKTSCYDLLKNNKCALIASRPVFFLDTKSKAPFKARMFKSDMKVLKESNYEVLDGKDLTTEDYTRLVELYQSLYIQKYSKYSPKLNVNFISLTIKKDILQIKVLKKEGKIDAVMGYFAKNGVATSPIFGYDTTLPQELGLYRMISTVLTLEAREQGLLVNQSAGASQYKLLRRAHSDLEYTAVYHRHLPFHRRLSWTMLGGVINNIGVPFMKHFGV